jgi:hypothetical protein
VRRRFYATSIVAHTAPMPFSFTLCQETVAISDIYICLAVLGRRLNIQLFFFNHIRCVCTFARCQGNACFILAKLGLC